MVSDSLSLPSRGSFHLSLAVLCSLSVHGVFSLRGWFPWLPTEWHVPWYSGIAESRGLSFPVRGCHPLWPPFPRRSGTVVSSTEAAGPPLATLQPRRRNALRLARLRFRLFPFRSPLLRESLLFSVPGATKMFQFAPFPFRPYEFRTE